MNKKITYFLMVLVTMLFTSISAMGQDNPSLTENGIAIGEALDSFEPNTWYFLYQGRTANLGAGSYPFTTVGEIPSMDGGVMTDMGVGKNVIKKLASKISSGSIATAEAGSLVRFIPTDEAGVYNIQFGTGNYLTEPDGKGNSKLFTTDEQIENAGLFNFYHIPEAEGSEENRSCFGFNVYNMAERVDNNGPDYTVTTWGSGIHDKIEGSNSIWSVVAVEWIEVDPKEIALGELSDAWTLYGSYVEEFAVGTLPGQFSEEAVNALAAAVAAADIESNSNDYTVEMIQQLIDNMKTAYEAVLATRVPLTVADGYYRFRNAMPYVKTIPLEGGEADDTEEVESVKYMYTKLDGETIYGMWGERSDLTSDAPSLWKITNKEGGLDIENMGYNSHFTTVTTSKNVTLSAASDSLMAIDPATTVSDEEAGTTVTYVNIRLASQKKQDYFYLHQANHGSGNDGIGHGAGSNLVGWSSGYNERGNGQPKASEWILEPVSETDAQAIIAAFEPIKNREVMLAAYDSIMTNAKEKLKIAEAAKYKTTIDEEKPLITSVSQLSSPYTETREGSLEALLGLEAESTHPGDAFWHSDWSSTIKGGIHYLQAEINEAEEIDAIAFQFTRRNVENDQITEWGVYGTNDSAAEKDACEALATINTPVSSNNETLIADAFYSKGYKYLRFYANMTTTNRGYFHIARFQLYPATIELQAEAQSGHMGDLYTDLANVVEAQKDLKQDEIQIEQYTALKQAYDAFIQKFVDPAELRQTLASVEGKSKLIVIGTQPGFWTDKSTGEALDKTIAEATAYDAAGDYTPAQSKQYVETLKEQSKAITAAAIGIKTSKWYKIRFAPEEMFDEYEWNKEAGNEQYNEAISTTTSQALFGKYATAAIVTEEIVPYTDKDGNEKKANVYEVENADPEELGLGSKIYLMDKDENKLPDMALFRFIAVGDSAYLLQNKGTGLFIKAAGTSGAVSLSVHPSLFNVRAIGYGMNVIPAYTLTGEKQSFLHTQVLQNVLVTWDVEHLGSRSALLIEEAEDVADEVTEFNMPVMPGSLTTHCYPMDLSVKAGEDATMWSVESVDVEQNTVTLVKVDEQAIGGRPFILIQNEEFDPEATADEQVMVVMKHTNAVTAITPQTSHLLKGTFASTKVGTGVLVAKDNGLAVTRSSSTTVDANSAYISDKTAYDRNATFTIAKSDHSDAIQTVITNISRPTAVYTIDGRLVSRRATINSLPKGVYVINSVKVVIK